MMDLEEEELQSIHQARLQNEKDFVKNRQLAYAATFNMAESHAVVTVLQDLALFCRASETTFDADPRKHAAMEGRREVWLRIMNHLNLPYDTLWLKQTTGFRK